MSMYTHSLGSISNEPMQSKDVIEGGKYHHCVGKVDGEGSCIVITSTRISSMFAKVQKKAH